VRGEFCEIDGLNGGSMPFARGASPGFGLRVEGGAIRSEVVAWQSNWAINATAAALFTGIRCDPIGLLGKIRHAQSRIAAFEQKQGTTEIQTEQTRPAPQKVEDVREQRAFLAGLRTAWRQGEVRPTHRKKIRAPRHWRTRRDPFEAAWPSLKNQLENSPGITAKELFQQLQKEQPDIFPDVQLRTLQRRVKDWRRDIVKRLLFGVEENLSKGDEVTVVATQPMTTISR
jgi:molybdopterin converting factor small subunit